MILFDAHCHLHDGQFRGCLQQVMARAGAAGVARMVCCGCDESNWETVREVAGEYQGVFPSFGLYPLDVPKRTPGWLEKLKSFLLSVPSGVGEIGLDNTIEGVSDLDQEAVFVAQLRLARELGRPVTIHCRKAFGRLLEILKQEGGVSHGGIMHTWSGSPELVRPFEDLGLCISFSGAITREGNRRGHKSIKAVSRERLLIETDSPGLMPSGIQGEFNEPANLPVIARAAAALLGETLEKVAELTFNNAKRLFSLKAG
ncbi:MAG: TatD family hydrolase [Kiritimatiellia bacterium]